MKIPYELMIGLRYLKSRRKKRQFISLISVISIAGVAIGVMALIIVLSVMTGFEEDLKEKILGTNSHLVVLQYGGFMTEHEEVMENIRGIDDVIGVTPFIYSQVMISSASGVSGVVIRGIEPESARGVVRLNDYIQTGSLDNLLESRSGDDLMPGVIIGSELANLLGVGHMDTVSIVSPAGNLTPMGTAPKMQKYKVVGIFKSGMYEYDTSLAYVSIKDAQSFLNMPEEVTGIEVSLKNIYDSDSVSKKIAERLGPPFFTRDWKEMNSNLFSALKLEKTVMFIILVLIILVAAFNIISTLIMIVMEKGKEIAILKSMGATPVSVMKVFIYEGLIIGVLGTALGCIGGIFLCLLLNRYEFVKLPEDIYYYHFSTLPVKMVWVDILVICVVSIVITFLATIYPSVRASRLRPVEAIRYE